MEKPTIFFSHSAKDRNVILPIKEKLIKITSGVIQIFMSSDGQSIPFGNNWIHKIEDGLNNAKIMFVFVTPTSIESGWIYFEAGFAYSKGIDVIPVGVGIDIGSIRPPLSLLQGFNITSSESLNNFVTVINKNFDLSFEPTFDEEDFAHLFRDFREMKSDLNFDNIFCSADYSIFASKSKPENCGGRSNILDVLNVIQNYLENNNYTFSANKNKDGTVTGLLVNGLKFRCISANSQMHIRDWEELRVTMSMFSFESSFELLKSLIQYAEIKDGAYLRFVPNTLHRKKPCLPLHIKTPICLSLMAKAWVHIVFAMKMYALRFSIKTSITMLNLLSIFLASALDRKIRLQNRCLIVSEI